MPRLEVFSSTSLLRPDHFVTAKFFRKYSATRLNDFKMSSTKVTNTNCPPNGDPPALPPNVFIFSPAIPIATNALLNGRLFTRLTVPAHTKSSQLVDAFRKTQQPKVNETFCIHHRNIVLIFDSDVQGQDLQDTHHEHFRAVCLALKDNNINLDVAGCVFDAPTALQAGFQFEVMSSGSVLVIDIMGGDDASDEDDQDDDGAGVQGFLLNGDLESTES